MWEFEAVKRMWRRMRIEDNKRALLQGRVVELRCDLDVALAKISVYRKHATKMRELRAENEGLRADMADVHDRLAQINETHRLIPKAIAPKFQARAKMFNLDGGLEDV